MCPGSQSHFSDDIICVHICRPDWARGAAAALAVALVAALAFLGYTTRERWLPRQYQPFREGTEDEEGRRQLVDIHTRSSTGAPNLGDQMPPHRGSGLSTSTPVSLQDESPPARMGSGISEAGSRSSMQHRPTRSGSLVTTPTSEKGFSDKGLLP